MPDDVECDFCGLDVPTRSVRVVRAAVQCGACAVAALAARLRAASVAP